MLARMKNTNVIMSPFDSPPLFAGMNEPSMLRGDLPCERNVLGRTGNRRKDLADQPCVLNPGTCIL
jgi:hypothetical protein